MRPKNQSTGKNQFNPSYIKDVISSGGSSSDDFQKDEISGLYKLIGEMGLN